LVELPANQQRFSPPDEITICWELIAREGIKGRVNEIPNSKHQIPNKFQIPSTKFQTNSKKKQNQKSKKQNQKIRIRFK